MGSGPHLMPLHAGTISPTRVANARALSARLLQLGKMGARTHSACGSLRAVLGQTLDFED
jgi:hypothetical protein